METLIKQYHEMKQKHPDALLLFRNNGHWPATYDLFAEDAIQAGEILGLTPDCSRETAYLSFHHDLLDKFLSPLVRAGRRMAICEQLEDPRLTKRLVKRGVSTPNP